MLCHLGLESLANGEEERFPREGEIGTESFFLLFFLLVLGIKTRASHVLSKCSSTKPHPQLRKEQNLKRSRYIHQAVGGRSEVQTTQAKPTEPGTKQIA